MSEKHPTPSLVSLSDDHLRVLFDDAVGRDRPLADATIYAVSYRRTEFGEEAWWIARQRCLDAWSELLARVPAPEVAARLTRVLVDRLEREVAHLWHGYTRDAGLAEEMLAWLAADRTRDDQATRVVRSLSQAAEGEDVQVIAVRDAQEIRGLVSDALRQIQLTRASRCSVMSPP